jgi:L-threonylcarbamoyladenylate synthase
MTPTVRYGTGAERSAAAAAVSEHLAGGGILVYPTETVYGLGCALQPEALAALARFKGPRPFLLLIRGPEDTPGLRWTDDARRLADAFWPGPLTLALTAEEGAYPPQVVGPDGGVAVRVSPHPAIPDLLEAAAGPITSTSANEPGLSPALDGESAARVGAAVEAVAGRVLVLDGGRLPPARPSTILRCAETTRLLREGAVPRSEVERLVELE